MKRFFSVSVIVITILFSITSCRRREEYPIPRATMKEGPIMDAQDVSPHGTPRQKNTFQVVVPEEVKGRWSAVKLMIGDKKLNKTQEFTVNLGGELRVPDSGLTVKIGPFLPNFKIDGNIITSASNAPDNPAVGVIIYEDGRQIFPEREGWGWLYAKYPDIHPFQHGRFGIILKKGIKRGLRP